MDRRKKAQALLEELAGSPSSAALLTEHLAGLRNGTARVLRTRYLALVQKPRSDAQRRALVETLQGVVDYSRDELAHFGFQPLGKKLCASAVKYAAENLAEGPARQMWRISNFPM